MLNLTKPSLGTRLCGLGFGPNLLSLIRGRQTFTEVKYILDVGHWSVLRETEVAMYGPVAVSQLYPFNLDRSDRKLVSQITMKPSLWMVGEQSRY